MKSGYNDTSKSKSWNVLETVLSHLKSHGNPHVCHDLIELKITQDFNTCTCKLKFDDNSAKSLIVR